jgi:hypothetical protein
MSHQGAWRQTRVSPKAARSVLSTRSRSWTKWASSRSLRKVLARLCDSSSPTRLLRLSLVAGADWASRRVAQAPCRLVQCRPVCASIAGQNRSSSLTSIAAEPVLQMRQQQHRRPPLQPQPRPQLRLRVHQACAHFAKPGKFTKEATTAEGTAKGRLRVLAGSME